MSRVSRSQSEGSQSGSKNQNSQENKPMSTSETVNKVVEAVKELITKSFNFINLDTLKNEKMEIKDIEFVPATETKDAFARLGNDDKTLLSLMNSELRNRTISEAKKAKLPTNAVPKKIALDFIKNFRVSPTFSGLVTLEKGQEGWKEQYNAQTDAIFTQIRQVPFMMDELKKIAAASTDDDDSE